MKIRVLGAGWYGAHLATALIRDGHQVELHESADRIFAGASGGIPSRLHIGTHYPRSRLTRAACQDHHAAFMRNYGELTHGVPVNIYAIAAHDSLVDFGNYVQTLRNEIEFVTVQKPEEFGLRNVEGAILTGERHVITDKARAFFEDRLKDVLVLQSSCNRIDDPAWDWTIDCTFCANDSANVERYEPCITGLLAGPVDRAVTVMDGPFPSLYPWDEEQGLSSLTSAKWTPLARCKTREEAQGILNKFDVEQARERIGAMFAQLGSFWPAALDLYNPVDYKLSIRAMPRSGSDARLVDVVKVGERALRIRAGKIDAIFDAERLVKGMIERRP